MSNNSGYHACPCRDCFEVAIGETDDGDPCLCHECEEADCDASGESECEAFGAVVADYLAETPEEER